MREVSKQMENKKITIDDIARELGISKTTVSRAISGKGRIGKETTERVKAFINEKNYKPSAIAKSLAQSKTFNIAFAMPGESKFVDLPYFQKCMWGIISAAAQLDYDVLLCMVGENDITGLERLIDNHKVDGVILGRTYENALAEDYLAQNDIPFVTIGTSAHEGAVQIDNDHIGACRELTLKLLDKGFKRLAVIGGRTEHIVNKNRMEGFKNAHKERGIDIDPSLVVTGSSDAEFVRDALKRVLTHNPDCIVCTDDSVCTTVLNGLMEMRLGIPKDIRVASFYNSTTLDNYKPSVTSIEFDASEAGRIACNTILEMIMEEGSRAKSLLGHVLLMRESTD